MYTEFSVLRNKCKLISKSCYTDYLKYIQQSLIHNPKYFWKFVKDRKQRNDLPNTMHLNNYKANNSSDIAELFKTYFSSVYTSNQASPIDYLHNTSFNKDTIDFSSCSFSVTEMFDALNKLSFNTKVGPDQIPEIIFRKCCYTLIQFIFIYSCLSRSMENQFYLSNIQIR